MTPLEKFENEKNEFLKRYAPDFKDADWKGIVQCFRDYAKAINTKETDDQEDYIPLAQLPAEEYALECLREEKCFQQRMLAVLADSNSAPSQKMLMIQENRPHDPIVDYYQILIFWREGQYEKVRALCLKVLHHINVLEWHHQKHCPLTPHYYKFQDKQMEKYLHPMVTDFSLSEIFYYLAMAENMLSLDYDKHLSGCYYFRARDCLRVDLLHPAEIYINKAISLKNSKQYQNLKQFLASLMNDGPSPRLQKANAEQACEFLKGNILLCRQYSKLLLEKGRARPKFLEKFAEEFDSQKVVKRRKLDKA